MPGVWTAVHATERARRLADGLAGFHQAGGLPPPDADPHTSTSVPPSDIGPGTLAQRIVLLLRDERREHPDRFYAARPEITGVSVPRRSRDDLTQRSQNRPQGTLTIPPDRRKSTGADQKITDQYTTQEAKVLLCPGTAHDVRACSLALLHPLLHLASPTTRDVAGAVSPPREPTQSAVASVEHRRGPPVAVAVATPPRDAQRRLPAAAAPPSRPRPRTAPGQVGQGETGHLEAVLREELNRLERTAHVTGPRAAVLQPDQRGGPHRVVIPKPGRERPQGATVVAPVLGHSDPEKVHHAPELRERQDHTR